MDKKQSRFFADDQGIWEQNESDALHSIVAWNLPNACGAKYQSSDQMLTSVEFDFVYGEVLEIFTDMPGFEQVVTVATEILPGISSSWLQSIIALQSPAVTITVWQRG